MQGERLCMQGDVLLQLAVVLSKLLAVLSVVHCFRTEQKAAQRQQGHPKGGG